MTKEELITKQALKIEEQQERLEEVSELKSQLINKLYAIGQPLNDNVLQMNAKQMKWCFEVAKLVEQL